jgi:hypothetical protein
MRRYCRAAVRVLPVDGAAITLISDPDRREPVWVTDETAAWIDAVQFTLAEGPCVDADSGRSRIPFFARTQASKVARDQSINPWLPISSSTARCSPHRCSAFVYWQLIRYKPLRQTINHKQRSPHHATGIRGIGR